MTITLQAGEPAKAGWVLAAPFRAHVHYLMETSQVPWPDIASKAGVSLSAMHTLLFGRNGHPRQKVPYQVAKALFTLEPENLK